MVDHSKARGHLGQGAVSCGSRGHWASEQELPVGLELRQPLANCDRPTGTWQLKNTLGLGDGSKKKCARRVTGGENAIEGRAMKG